MNQLSILLLMFPVFLACGLVVFCAVYVALYYFNLWLENLMLPFLRNQEAKRSKVVTTICDGHNTFFVNKSSTNIACLVNCMCDYAGNNFLIKYYIY